MQTNFKSPNNIAQKSVETHESIPWNDLHLATGNDSYSSLSAPLYTISGLWMERFRIQTNQIWATGYSFTPSGLAINGIEVRVNIKRNARIEDLLIQLTLNGELIGQNYAIIKTSQEAYWTNTEQPGDFHVYGGTLDMWGTTLSVSDINDPTFGVVLAYQSNETLPHRDIAYINQVAMRVNFE